MSVRAIGVMIVLAASPAPASAAWPAGGDSGRTGFASDFAGAEPLRLAFTIPSAAVTTPVIVADAPREAERRIAWGTDADGATVHLHRLGDGSAVAPPVVVDEDSPRDSLSPAAAGFRGTLGFVSSSRGGRHGRLSIVHVDGGALEIAQIDEATGARVDANGADEGTDVVLPDSIGAATSATPLLGPPASDGSRALYFTSYTFEREGPRVWRVPVVAAGTPGERIDTGGIRTATADPHQPVPVALADLTAGGRAHVFFANQNLVRTLRADDLSPGPVTESFGEASDRVPLLAVASGGGASALFAVEPKARALRRFALEGKQLRSQASVALPNVPDGLAVSGDRVYASAGSTTYVLDRSSLARVGEFPGSRPAAAADRIYASAGEDAVVVRAGDLSVSRLTGLGVGTLTSQPALSAGRAVFAGARGVAVTIASAPQAPASGPAPAASPPAVRASVRRLSRRRVRVRVQVKPCRPGLVDVRVRRAGKVVERFRLRLGPGCVVRRTVRVRGRVRASARYVGA